jgi:hypothetical protein
MQWGLSKQVPPTKLRGPPRAALFLLREAAPRAAAPGRILLRDGGLGPGIQTPPARLDCHSYSTAKLRVSGLGFEA